MRLALLHLGVLRGILLHKLNYQIELLLTVNVYQDRTSRQALVEPGGVPMECSVGQVAAGFRICSCIGQREREARHGSFEIFSVNEDHGLKSTALRYAVRYQKSSGARELPVSRLHSQLHRSVQHRARPRLKSRELSQPSPGPTQHSRLLLVTEGVVP